MDRLEFEPILSIYRSRHNLRRRRMCVDFYVGNSTKIVLATRERVEREKSTYDFVFVLVTCEGVSEVWPETYRLYGLLGIFQALKVKLANFSSSSFDATPSCTLLRDEARLSRSTYTASDRKMLLMGSKTSIVRSTPLEFAFLSSV